MDRHQMGMRTHRNQHESLQTFCGALNRLIHNMWNGEVKVITMHIVSSKILFTTYKKGYNKIGSVFMFNYESFLHFLYKSAIILD